jgi:hypothetical protein
MSEEITEREILEIKADIFYVLCVLDRHRDELKDLIARLYASYDRLKELERCVEKA